jgi:hypothetical protein
LPVAVLQGDEKYRRFVKGTNSAVYPRLNHTEDSSSSSKQKKGEKETVSALSNLRPQHLTDAYMIRPIDTSTGLIYSQSEFFQEEADTRPQAKKGARIMRGYYLLEELSEPKGGESQVLRRFWFDRVDKIRLARLQTFDAQGQIVTDVSYFDEKQIGSGRYGTNASEDRSHASQRSIQTQPYLPGSVVGRFKQGIPTTGFCIAEQMAAARSRS